MSGLSNDSSFSGASCPVGVIKTANGRFQVCITERKDISQSLPLYPLLQKISIFSCIYEQV